MKLRFIIILGIIFTMAVSFFVVIHTSKKQKPVELQKTTIKVDVTGLYNLIDTDAKSPLAYSNYELFNATGKRIAYEEFEGNRIIKLTKGTRLILSGAKLKKFKPFVVSKKISSGMYRVGIEIQAGRYLVKPITSSEIAGAGSVRIINSVDPIQFKQLYLNNSATPFQVSLNSGEIVSLARAVMIKEIK